MRSSFLMRMTRRSILYSGSPLMEKGWWERRFLETPSKHFRTQGYTGLKWLATASGPPWAATRSTGRTLPACAHSWAPQRLPDTNSACGAPNIFLTHVNIEVQPSPSARPDTLMSNSQRGRNEGISGENPHPQPADFKKK